MQMLMERTVLHAAMVAILMLLLPAAASAYDFEADGIYYDLVDGHAVVTNNGQYNCYSGDIVIPAAVTNEGTTYPVTVIGHSAFKNCTELITSVLPGSITTIEPRVFEGCKSLTSMIVPNTVTTMGANVFDKCYAIDSIVIGNKVTSLGDYMFNDCRALKKVVIGNSVTSIGKYAFSGCGNLTRITIPNSVTSIGHNAFYCCSQLADIKIGSAVTNIDQYIFYNCSRLTCVTCLAVTPPNVVYGLFNEYNYYGHAELHVLQESVQAYKSATFWKDFYYIIGDVTISIPGDVNGDGEVTVADANSAIKIIINGSGGHSHAPNGDDEFYNADVNDDGEVNIADLNVIIDLILKGR